MLFICPKAGECKYICGSSHDKPHNQKDGCIGYPLQGCPACIPVPSTPASHMKKISYCSVCQRETSFEDGYCLEHPNKTGGVGKPLPPDELLTERARNEMMQADIARIMADKDGLDGVPDDIWADYQGYAAMILAKVSASFSAQLAEALKAQKEHILAEVDKAGLTDEQLYHLEQDYGWGKDTEERGFILSVVDIAAAAQLEAIKKQLRGEGK